MAREAVQTLGLALHELATNSSKYGALSVPEGNIVLQWKFYEDIPEPECFRVIWREHGGPTVKPPLRKGFGSFVLGKMMKQGLTANVNIDFAPAGVIWTLSMPASYATRE